MQSVVIAGEYYSHNLGDGVIAEALCYLFKQAAPELDVKLIDLSHRTEYCATPPCSIIRATGVISKIVSWLCKTIIRNHRMRRSVQYWVIWRFRERKTHHEFMISELSGAAALIIGGGQLLMDNSLVFPYRIHSTAHSANELSIPIAFHACGVGDSWSWMGRRLFNASLCPASVVSISCRDNNSVQKLKTTLPQIAAKVSLAIDPAICAAEAYGISAALESKTIGLGVIAPTELLGQSKFSQFADESYSLAQWGKLINKLSKRGYPIALFTNGSEADYVFASKVYNSALEVGVKDISLLPRPQVPRELVVIIAQFRAIIAYRLHAIIIATSLGIPSIGFIWDEKVQQFGRESNREEYFLEPDKVTAEDVVEKLRLMCRGIFPEVEIACLKSNAAVAARYTLQQLGIYVE